MGLGTFTAGLQGASGGASVPLWDALPVGAEGDRLNATLSASPVVAARGASSWRIGHPTNTQLESLWPAAEQSPGSRIGPMATFWEAVDRSIPERVYWIGDSNTVGQGATVDNVGCRSFSPPKLVADALGWRDGCACAHGLVVADPRVVANGWTSAVKEIPGSCWVHDTTPADLTITLDVPFDRLLITGVAVPGNGATSTVLIDDVSVGTIEHDAGVTLDWLPTLDISVARGLHVIKIRSGGGGGTCYINTVESFDSLSSAIELVHLGIADSNIADHINAAPYAARTRIKRFCGPGTTAFMGTINDLDDGVPLATIQAGFETLAGLWTARPGSQFVGIGGWATERPGITPADLDALNATLLSLSEATLGSHFDTRGVLGRTAAEMDPADIADPWHLTAQGYGKQATQLQAAFE